MNDKLRGGDRRAQAMGPNLEMVFLIIIAVSAYVAYDIGGIMSAVGVTFLLLVGTMMVYGVATGLFPKASP